MYSEMAEQMKQVADADVDNVRACPGFDAARCLYMYVTVYSEMVESIKRVSESDVDMSVQALTLTFSIIYLYLYIYVCIQKWLSQWSV